MRDIDNQSRASTHEHNNHSPQRNDDLSSYVNNREYMLENNGVWNLF